MSGMRKVPVLMVVLMALAGHAAVLAASSPAVATILPIKKPTRISYLHEIILHIESGNQRYDENGNLITSNRGAMGEMQVMPHTVADPGYGVTPAKRDCPEEYARVGRDYFDALVRTYKGNLSLAFAAYNAGPAKVNRAVAKAERLGGNWLSYLPRETRRYVQKGMARVTAATAPKPERIQIASAY